MSKQDYITFRGTVTDVLPNNTFKVTLSETDASVLAYMSGRMRQMKIKVILGDEVDVEMSPYDAARGRISFRHK